MPSATSKSVWRIHVENSRSKRVDNNQSESIGHNKNIEVGNNHHEVIGGNMTLMVGPNILQKGVTAAPLAPCLLFHSLRRALVKPDKHPVRPIGGLGQADIWVVEHESRRAACRIDRHRKLRQL